MARIFLIVCCSTVLAGSALGQSLGDFANNSGAFYTFADPSDITVDVKVWGAVRNPGLYEVRQGLHLSTLLTLAGGPQLGQYERGSTQTLSLRLYRPRSDGRYEVVLEKTMENELLALDEDPTLLNGDVLVVEVAVRRHFGWRDGVQLLTAAGTVALVVERIIRIANNE